MFRTKPSFSSDACTFNHGGSGGFGRKEAFELESIRYDVRSRSEREVKGRHVCNRDMLTVATGYASRRVRINKSARAIE